MCTATWGKNWHYFHRQESVCFLLLNQESEEAASSLGLQLSQGPCPNFPSFSVPLLGVFHRSPSPAACEWLHPLIPIMRTLASLWVFPWVSSLPQRNLYQSRTSGSLLSKYKQWTCCEWNVGVGWCQKIENLGNEVPLVLRWSVLEQSSTPVQNASVCCINNIAVNWELNTTCFYYALFMLMALWQ